MSIFCCSILTYLRDVGWPPSVFSLWTSSLSSSELLRLAKKGQGISNLSVMKLDMKWAPCFVFTVEPTQSEDLKPQAVRGDGIGRPSIAPIAFAAMGAGASAELAKATVEEVQKVHAELSPEDQEKLKQGMAQLEKTSLVSGSPTTVSKPAPKRSVLEMLTQGCSNAENCDSMKPTLQEMFFRIDRDENGKVKVSELGGCADMILKMVQDVDDSIETKEDLMKSFDA